MGESLRNQSGEGALRFLMLRHDCTAASTAATGTCSRAETHGLGPGAEAAWKLTGFGDERARTADTLARASRAQFWYVRLYVA